MTTPPTAGLGATMDLLERIVGTEDPELLVLMREARAPGQGARTDLILRGDSPRSHGGQDVDYTAERLAREAPEKFAAVQRGELTIHAAAIAAGIRKRRIPVRLDDAPSALRSLRANASPEFWEEFKRLVAEA